ncbi:MAG TPA: IS66 family transposase [Solirubrobacteraceae bacterium]|nr:IS66 family transposase [Solirubrobacteraceae bacterium]
MPRLEEIDDFDTLKLTASLLEKTVISQQKTIAKLEAEIARLHGADHPQLEIKILEEQLAQLRRQVFAPSSEKRPGPRKDEDPERSPQPGHGPRKQPRLPIEVVTHELGEEERHCPVCGGELAEMKDQCEESEEITVVEASYTIVTHRRKKYRCRCNAAVVTAPGPAKLIPGGRYSPELAVHVAVAKYLDHLPLDRQARAMGRRGLVVGAQTLWDQLFALYRHLEPCYEALCSKVLTAEVGFTDETRWPLVDQDGRKRYWAWCLSSEDAVAYWIKDARSKDAGGEVLSAFRGVLMCDGYAVYKSLARDGPKLSLAHCWAHVRRKFVEAEGASELAAVAIGLIGKLYAVEREAPLAARDADPEEKERALERRHALRQERSRPIVEELKAWAWATAQGVLPRSGIGKAIAYMLELWPGLTVFLDDPRVPLDNNQAERVLRGLVVGRKNHYGSRSKRGVEVAALFYTLLESAKLAGVDPHAYLLEATKRAIAEPGTVTLPDDAFCVE